MRVGLSSTVSRWCAVSLWMELLVFVLLARCDSGTATGRQRRMTCALRRQTLPKGLWTSEIRQRMTLCAVALQVCKHRPGV